MDVDGVASRDRMAANVNAVRQKLSVFKNIVALHFQPDQILFYAGHIPVGLYVVLKGSLVMQPSETTCHATSGARRDAFQKPFVVPACRELDTHSLCSAMAETEVDALLIPRSLLVEHPELLDMLEQEGLGRCSDFPACG